jgi:hypothetical protein
MDKETLQKIKEAGIDRTTYYYRLRKGWEDPFTPRQRKEKNRITPEVKEALDGAGITKEQYYSRLRKGWSEFEAANTCIKEIFLKYKGQPVIELVSPSRYRYMYRLMDKGMSQDEAIEYIVKLQEKADARQSN